MQVISKLSNIKYNITNSIRYLECIEDSIKFCRSLEYLSTELSYWIATLDLIRIFIESHNDENDIEFNLYVRENLEEIQDEIYNCSCLYKKCFDRVNMSRLFNAIEYCRKAKDLIDD